MKRSYQFGPILSRSFRPHWNKRGNGPRFCPSPAPSGGSSTAEIVPPDLQPRLHTSKLGRLVHARQHFHCKSRPKRSKSCRRKQTTARTAIYASEHLLNSCPAASASKTHSGQLRSDL